MKIPERADKWIVFAYAFAAGLVDLLHSTGIDIDAKSIIVVPLLGAAILTIVYLVWLAMSRLTARLLLKNRSSGSVRVFANSAFFGAFLLLLVWPFLFPGHVTTVTFKVPAKVKIQTPDSPSTRKDP